MELLQKAATLLLLASGKRPKEIRDLTLSGTTRLPYKYIFTIPVHTKTSRAKVPADREFEIKKFPSNPKVCPYTTLYDYIKRTESCRRCDNIFITTTGTYSAVAGATLARWTRVVMDNAGIDTSFFSPYSTRVASASKLASKTGSLQRVLELGKWRGTSSFFNHYLRKVKYFSRESTVQVKQRKTSTHVYGNIIPASPVRKRANYALKKSLERRRQKRLCAPHTELPSNKQGYLSLSSSSTISSIHIFDKPDELQDFPTDDSCSVISTCSTLPEQSYHPVPSPPPPTNSLPVTPVPVPLKTEENVASLNVNSLKGIKEITIVKTHPVGKALQLTAPSATTSKGEFPAPKMVSVLKLLPEKAKGKGATIQNPSAASMPPPFRLMAAYKANSPCIGKQIQISFHGRHRW